MDYTEKRDTQGHSTTLLYPSTLPRCVCSVRVHFIQRKDLLRALFGCMSFVRCMAPQYHWDASLSVTGMRPSVSLGYVPRYHWDASLSVIGIRLSVSLGCTPQCHWDMSLCDVSLSITGIHPSVSLGYKYVPQYHWDASLIIIGICPSVSLGYVLQYPSLSITGIHPRIRPSVSLPTEVYLLHHSKPTFPYSVTL